MDDKELEFHLIDLDVDNPWYEKYQWTSKIASRIRHWYWSIPTLHKCTVCKKRGVTVGDWRYLGTHIGCYNDE